MLFYFTPYISFLNPILIEWVANTNEVEPEFEEDDLGSWDIYVGY
jgi:hypothetical protein